ncbi:hypothetical protein ENHAE0001_2614 [Enhydrobacter aerosaccus SK60]|nr:hypothetical protein ENHAE0001_2614 [Enhydrobacter aerosaccus SK60]
MILHTIASLSVDPASLMPHLGAKRIAVKKIYCFSKRF